METVRSQNAFVTPRIISPHTGDAVPIEMVLLETEGHDRGAIEIVAGDGAGKTTALACLSRLLSPQCRYVLLDEPDPLLLAQTAATSLTIYTSRQPRSVECIQSFVLARWGDDEWLEYLLAAHPKQCCSVANRLRRAPDRHLPDGNPQLWSVTLEQMVANEAITDVGSALECELRHRLPADFWDRQFDERHIGGVPRSERGEDASALLAALFVEPRLIGLLRHRVMQVMLAAVHLSRAIERGQYRWWLAGRLPRDTVDRVAATLSPDGVANLRQMTEENQPEVHAMAASILHAAHCGWTPQPLPMLRLDGAYLANADWPGIDLSDASLRETDFSRSDLTGARLGRATADRADFSGAALRRADMQKIQAASANFTEADLTQADCGEGFFRAASLQRTVLCRAILRRAEFASADLSGARVREADASHAHFRNAILRDADFSLANLTGALLSGTDLRHAVLLGARFRDARLTGCDLEGVELPDADFERANLVNANLTASRIRRGCFREANLCGAAMADIDWEQADLRNANLRGCVFHMGSSRSGLVGSPLASEGSRTGFYTDEYDQQSFRPPEEIRKANLRGADLRGANLRETDFYLVDLRDAKYSRSQFEHFRRSGAILFDPHNG